jgi:gas vesicle protein
MEYTGATRSTGPESGSTGAAGQVQDKAQQVAGQAQEKAQEAAGQAKGQLRSQVDQRSTQAGEQVSSTASDIRSVAEQLREQGKDQPAKLAEQAAARAERVGGYLKESDTDRILHDIEDFGRRQPLAIMFGGLALGFMASRFLKASSQNRSEGRYHAGPTSGTYYPSAPRSTGQLPPAGGTSTPVTPPTTHPAPPVAPLPQGTPPGGGMSPGGGL